MFSRFPWLYPGTPSLPEIDWSNPINRGLVNCIWGPSAAGVGKLRDLVAPEYTWPTLTTGSGVPLAWTGAGPAPDFNTSNAYSSNFVQLVSPQITGYTAVAIVRPNNSIPAADRFFFGFGASTSNNPILSFYHESTADAGHIQGYIRNDTGQLGGFVNGGGSQTTEALVAGRTYRLLWSWNPLDSYRNGTSSYVIRVGGGKIYATTGGTISGALTLDRFCVNGLQRATQSNTGECPVIGPWIWNRPLTEQEACEVVANPLVTLRSPPQRYFVFAQNQNLAVSIDTAGAAAFSGQNQTANVSVNVDAGTLTAAGQAVSENVTVNLQAGAATFAGQDVTAFLSDNLFIEIDAPGEATFSGEDVTAFLSDNLAVTIDTPGEATFAGQEVDVDLVGDIFVEIDVPGEMTFEGQDVTAFLTGNNNRGRFGRGERTPKLRKPEDIPPLEFDVLVRQPSQDFTCVFEVSSEEVFEIEQAPAEPFVALSVSSEIRVNLEQAWQDFYSKLIGGAMWSAPPPVMPLHKTARAQVRIFQPAQAFDIELETSE